MSGRPSWRTAFRGGRPVSVGTDSLDPDHLVRLVGGPLDGSLVTVPKGMLQTELDVEVDSEDLDEPWLNYNESHAKYAVLTNQTKSPPTDADGNLLYQYAPSA